ncbi:LLM class flavin-dependent oxidoreductase [Acuticoccus sediminis]|uniref:LLM class flavin-dependent oxidoreductase n=1 Tax=Acuticoccus sediminis TaxID=2184697 RepID=UPI001CFEDDFB|nr:LLM class flavin-dependent oxidoreductase [Acuticoccus sediminis]
MTPTGTMSSSPPAAPVTGSVFRDGALSIGIMAPLRRAPGIAIDYREQVDFAVRADALGFAAYWVRDVPLNGPWYPEAFGHLDPFVALGSVATRTQRIALGTAAAVLTLRHPLHVAKAAASLQALSGGRLLLGLGAGDRPQELAAFGEDIDRRGDTFRERWTVLDAALRSPARLPVPGADYELRPAPHSPPGRGILAGTPAPARRRSRPTQNSPSGMRRARSSRPRGRLRAASSIC